MPDKSKLKGRVLVISILAIVIVWVIILSQAKYQTSTLPILGEKFSVTPGDTTYHTIEKFGLTSQYGKPFTQDSVYGKIHLASFFFTTCPTVCPNINNNLNLIVNKFRNINDVVFVSYSVDPETDSVPKLAKYAKRYNQPNWRFVTGNKSRIYQLAEYSYLAIGKGGSKENWAHTEKLTLVDEKGRIRAIFEGQGGQIMINEAIDAIKLLRLEKNRNAESKNN